MKSRDPLYVLILIAYSLSLAHSVVPHHHHKTTEEASAHKHAADDHHHDSGKHSHDHEGNSSEKGPESTDHFFFFNHDLNGDVFIKHGSVDSPVKSKRPQASDSLNEQIISFTVMEHLVFHPPQDDPTFDLPLLSSNNLRGPPYLISGP